VLLGDPEYVCTHPHMSDKGGDWGASPQAGHTFPRVWPSPFSNHAENCSTTHEDGLAGHALKKHIYPGNEKTVGYVAKLRIAQARIIEVPML